LFALYDLSILSNLQVFANTFINAEKKAAQLGVDCAACKGLPKADTGYGQPKIDSSFLDYLYFRFILPPWSSALKFGKIKKVCHN
jgi:hypothetical protein